MAETKTARKSAPGRNTSDKVWTDEERAAMKEHAKEMKRAAKRGADKAAGEADLLEKLAEMPADDRAMAEKIHAIVKEHAPDLEPRTWYGMPAYAKEGKVLCFFTPAAKFKERYASFGFNAVANLDDGNMWPTAWAVEKIGPKEAAASTALIKQAVS